MHIKRKIVLQSCEGDGSRFQEALKVLDAAVEVVEELGYVPDIDETRTPLEAYIRTFSTEDIETELARRKLVQS